MTTSTAPTPTPDVQDPVTHLMAVTNQRLNANLLPGSNAHSGWLASIRCGITPHGELQALPAAGRYIAALSQDGRRGAIRAAAIRAINKSVNHANTQPLGRSLARLAAKDGGDSINQQVAALPLLNLEAATLVLDGLIGRCGPEGIAVDFFGLARVLTLWGDGAGSKSRNVRNRIVLDFFASPTNFSSQAD